MEITTDYEIYGEILIPLENSNFFDNKENLSLKEISDCLYINFRNILFEGELLRFIIVMKCDNYSKLNFDKLVFKVDFEDPNSKNSGQSEDSVSVNDENEISFDLFTVNTSKINEKKSKFEEIARNYYDEEKHICIYEIFKQIIVPKSFVGNNLIMKLQLMIKNEEKINQFNILNDDEESDTIDFYKHELYDTTEHYTLIKTLFKEIQIIKPVNILSLKQFDFSVETSLLQLKIQNSTENLNFIDKSLKNSKFLKKPENLKMPKIFKFLGNTITIKEINILEEETSLGDNQMHDSKKYFKNRNKIYFDLLGTQLPVILNPKEEYILSLKVNKNSFYEAKDELKDDIIQEKEEEIPEKAEDENENENETNINRYQELRSNRGSVDMISIDNKPKKTMAVNSNNVTRTSSGKKMTRLKANSIMIKRSSQFFMNDKLLNAVGNPLFSETGNTAGNKNNIFTSENSYDYDDSSIGEGKIKIFLVTPIILYISSDFFYENLFIGLEIKWVNEIFKFLKVEMKVPKDICLNEFFEISVKVRNISSESMNLFIEIKDSDYEDEQPNKEYLPSITAQTKFQNLGKFNCNEDKVVLLKFLPCKIGATKLPNFVITDAISKMRFLIVHRNKIIIQSNTNNLKKNQLNKFISKNFN